MIPSRVKLSARARLDADRMFDYLAKRSPEGAESWTKAFFGALDRLSEDPDRFPLSRESEELEVEIRELFFQPPKGNPYRILFVVREEIAFVTCIRGTGQDTVTLSDLDLPNDS